MSLSKRGKYWWYEFWFAGRRIQESSKSASKSVAKLAEQKRRRELEEGFNSIEDQREEQVRTIRERAKAYLESYVLRNQSATFAEYALKHINEHLADRMLCDIDDGLVREYQDARLRENAAPKTINEEVGFWTASTTPRNIVKIYRGNFISPPPLCGPRNSNPCDLDFSRARRQRDTSVPTRFAGQHGSFDKDSVDREHAHPSAHGRPDRLQK